MENQGLISTIYKIFVDGGFWMYPILFVQIASLALIGERYFQLFIARKSSQRKLVKKFENPIRSGSLQQAVSLANSESDSNPIYKVVKAGIQSAMSMGGKEEIRSKMDEVLLIENEKLEKRTGFLAMLANVSTLLGLLGTIVGLIMAFAAVGDASSAADKATILTQGISVAMNTTAFGLIVAIPALIMYSILQNRADFLKEDLHQASFRVFNWLNFNYENVGTRSTTKKVKEQF